MTIVNDDPSVDLVLEPPDAALMARMSYRVAMREGWIPWRRNGDTLVIATAVPPTQQAARVAAELFGAGPIEFRTTSPAALRNSFELAHRDQLLFESADRLATERPLASARSGLSAWQRRLPLAAVAMLAAGFAWDPLDALVTLLVIANLLFLTNIAFKIIASFLVPTRNLLRSRRDLAEVRERLRRGLPAVWEPFSDDSDLPAYTVLVPAYKEANVVAKLVTNLGAIDYPSSKLDVMLLLEADDQETIDVARSMALPDHMRVVIVPPGTPQTKPRACNYGLAFARGKYAVIFDAEDRPDPQQLRTAVEAFERDRFERETGTSARPPLAIVQASLHYFNADYNVLTRMFAIEYAHWFEAMLPGMDTARLPLPLGGTSNHFDVSLLRDMGGWDPYNVTEDADAGLRASLMGYRVAVIPSSTGEEACAHIGAWIKQRTRWIKGYMITAAVNTRRPARFARAVGVRGVIGMAGLIIATPLAFLAYPLALSLTIATYIGVQFIGLTLPPALVQVSVATFVVGNLVMIVSAGLAATWRYNWRIGIFAIFSPVYWLLHSIAAWRALYQVIWDPHRWEKTPHGLTEDYESEAHV
ncbi:glycosyl transferase [Nocardioides szechwanensis]|uniref:Glycosyltransferase, catalytic subunit of cellulose synthase and poly-beta-1,6-N-acetylglucosamine synthase n=1 Tax=Nocardioides szechwanensis TaxID=1005944 RepID=A0A1H0ACH3_9ACTN|nr:glycosyltransferase [Nocardioides szechwanensis]GEP34895.1 glycosyl transferase [Nocardioides szechwanensis]SDN31318.1 Glycosyltransferase, catalytic subunit of cellulose synthase and poly-beta-1,6-N-acetylglucosamine synthase [Nocardioides szechwanensis]